MNNARLSYFIRLTNVGIFNALVEAAERLANDKNAKFAAHRRGGYYEFVTSSAALWHELYLYGQMLAQAQDEEIDGGERRTT
jgi:hypothetical protein